MKEMPIDPKELGIEPNTRISPEKENSNINSSEQNNAENDVVRKVVTLLELAEEALVRKSILSTYEVEDLKKEINEAQSKGTNLSSIDNLDERIRSLEQEAALAELKGLLEKTTIFKGDEKKRTALATWYWFTLKKFDSLKHRVKPEAKDGIQKELDEIREELEIK